MNEKDTINFRKLTCTYLSLLKSREYVYYIIINSLSYITLFSFVAISPTIIVSRLEYNVITFGHIFLLFSSALLLMNIIVPKLSERIDLRKLSALGALIMLIGSITFIALNMHSPNLQGFFIPMVITGLGCGIIRPVASAGAMQLFPPKIAGKTAALYSFSFYIRNCNAICQQLNF